MLVLRGKSWLALPQVRQYILKRSISLQSSGPWTFADDMSLTHARNLDVTFEDHLPPPSQPRAVGEPITPGSHLVFFNHCFPESQLSTDGYDGSQAPKGNFPNRRWYGGSVEFNINNHLRLGEPASCTETVTDIRSSGDGKRVNVGIERVMQNEGDSQWSVREKRSMFYFADEPRLIQRQFGRHYPSKYTPQFTHKLHPSRVLLFRYSALNFNAHLIHYDTIYSREQEHLPDVLVQGPMMVTMALWWASEGLFRKSKRKISSFNYRNLAPLTLNEDALFCATAITQDLYEIWIQKESDGGVVFTAQLVVS